MAIPAGRADTVSFVSRPDAGPVQATSPASASPGTTDPAMSRAARLWDLLGRIDAALVSLAAIVWSELLCALALAGECAAGTRSFPPDLLDEDGNPSRRSSAELTELLSDR